jgi:integration host factor subunit beta
MAVDASLAAVLYQPKMGDLAMLRSELVSKLQEEMQPMRAADVENAVDVVLDEIAQALAEGGRVELRGFGAFSVRKREARTGRNPRTGAAVKVAAKRVPFFKPGKELRLNVNGGVEP